MLDREKEIRKTKKQIKINIRKYNAIFFIISSSPFMSHWGRFQMRHLSQKETSLMRHCHFSFHIF